MKKFLLLLLSVFPFLTSCSGIFEPYNTSLTIQLPGSNGRAASEVWGFDGIKKYEVMLVKNGELPLIKDSEAGLIKFDNLEPGEYMVLLTTYADNGRALYTGKAVENGSLYVSLKAGQNKTVEIVLSKFNSNCKNVVALFDSKDVEGAQDYYVNLQSKIVFNHDWNVKTCIFMEGIDDYENAAAFKNDIESRVADYGDFSALDENCIEKITDKYSSAKSNPEMLMDCLGSIKWDSSKYFVQVYKFEKDGEDPVYAYTNVVTIKGEYTAGGTALWSGSDFYAFIDGKECPDVPLLTEKVEDFFFDKYGNLVVSYQKESVNYIERFKKTSSGYQVSGEILAEDNTIGAAIQLCYDADNDILYAGFTDIQYCIYEISEFSKRCAGSISFLENADYFFSKTDVKDFVVNGNDFYLIVRDEGDSYYRTIYKINKSDTSPNKFLLGFDVYIFYSLTDITFKNGKLYVLLAERESSLARGALISMDENLTVDSVKQCFMSSVEINTDDSCLYGPQKFITADNYELVIADDGYKGDDQVNRVIRVNISGEEPEVSEMTDVDVEFDYEVFVDEAGQIIFNER